MIVRPPTPVAKPARRLNASARSINRFHRLEVACAILDGEAFSFRRSVLGVEADMKDSPPMLLSSLAASQPIRESSKEVHRGNRLHVTFVPLTELFNKILLLSS